MRLIDADELENMKFSNGFNEDGILYVPFGEVLRNIRTAPTAYDVEKVVEELEKEKFEVPDCRFDVDLNTTIDMAIDIVKRGGVE